MPSDGQLNSTLFTISEPFKFGSEFLSLSSKDEWKFNMSTETTTAGNEKNIFGSNSNSQSTTSFSFAPSLDTSFAKTVSNETQQFGLGLNGNPKTETKNLFDFDSSSFNFCAGSVQSKQYPKQTKEANNNNGSKDKKPDYKEDEKVDALWVDGRYHPAILYSSENEGMFWWVIYCSFKEALLIPVEHIQCRKQSSPIQQSIIGYKTTYKILKQGNGSRFITKGNTVTVDAKGIIQGQDKFWSTKDPGQKPFTYQAGVGTVITGWDQGCLGMKIGEKRELTIPSEEGYGKYGFPAWKIPGNAVIVFTLECLKID